ncbi:unnamed protein product [Clonostachys rosea]|uniref:Uncharacterized protein n=1 Tax=Bionectria ochroleuca TaxID=29856 RepID=A0ABY6V1T5_BIOOC|nr:unnamed protein product [Clonostachys rosea]
MSASEEGKEDFLLRLERDLMETHHYCALCMRLHRFPCLNIPNEYPPFRHTPACLGSSYEISQSFSENHFAYHHGRAAMNRHLYGAPAGLDIRSPRYETLYRDASLKIEWHASPGRFSAKIICDSLFLGENLLDSAKVPTMTSRLDRGYYDVCPHTMTGLITGRMECCTRAAGLSLGEISKFMREPGRVVPGSCQTCLTDYTTVGALGPRYLTAWKYGRGPTLASFEVRKSGNGGLGGRRLENTTGLSSEIWKFTLLEVYFKRYHAAKKQRESERLESSV